MTAETQTKGKMVRIRGLEPLRLAALPPQSSVSHNRISSDFLTSPVWNDYKNPSVLTTVLTRCKKRPKKRFQRVANGLYRFKRTGTYYSVFKVGGKEKPNKLYGSMPLRRKIFDYLFQQAEQILF
jgi:hypothetical protein